MPVRLTPASRVVTGPRLPGTAPRARIPRVARERRRVIEVCVPHSSTNTSRAGSTPRICLRHSARASSSRSVALRLFASTAAPPAAAARPGCARLRAPVAGRRSPATSPTATPARRRRRETPRRARPGWHPRRPPAGPAARPAAAGAASAPGRAAARSPPGRRWPAGAPDTAPRSAATPRTAPPPATGSSPHRPRPRSAHASPSSTPAPRRHSPANRHPSTNQHTAVSAGGLPSVAAPRSRSRPSLADGRAGGVHLACDVARPFLDGGPVALVAGASTDCPEEEAPPQRRPTHVDHAGEHPVVPRSAAAWEPLLDLLDLAAGQPARQPGAFGMRQSTDAEAPQARCRGGRDTAEEVQRGRQPGHAVHGTAHHHRVKGGGVQVGSHRPADHGRARITQHAGDALGDALGRSCGGGVADKYAARLVHAATLVAGACGSEGRKAVPRGPEVVLVRGGRADAAGERDLRP